jgi:hypothetical protein
MTNPTSDGSPRILPLRPADGSLAGLLEPLVVAAARPGVRLGCEVDPRLGCEVDAAALAGLLAPLVEAAVAAALEPDPASEVPALREVLVTVVDTGHALEIEVADSGPARPAEPPTLAVRRLLAAVGGTIGSVACAEGGTAVTLSLPRRRARGLAA